MDPSEYRQKYPHAPIPKSTFTTFMDEGRMHYRARHYRKALYCFDRALQLQPDNTVALVSRSQCRLKLGDADGALKDAQASMATPHAGGQNVVGLYQYGEALFNLGMFEDALKTYHQGFRLRKDREEFRVGVNKAQDAISRAIGDQRATQVEDLDVILPKIEAMENESKKSGHCCVLPELNEARDPNAIGKMTAARTRWVDREILGVLHHDKDYLIKFLKRPDIKGDAQASSEGLRQRATEAVKYLQIREDFWRQQYPMYSRKPGLTYNNDMVRQYEQEEQEKMEITRRIKTDAAQGAVQKNISQIQHALQIARFRDAQLECDRALRQIREISPKLLPRKAEFMTEILHYKGLALMRQKMFDAANTSFQEEFKIASEAKHTESRNRALDYLGRSYALKGSFAEAAEVWDSLLAISKQPVERAYLNHEIGRCYYETNKIDLARIYGTQCLEEATVKIGPPDDIWAMNAEILLAQAEIKAKNYQKAMEYFEKAHEYATTLGNKPNISLLQEAEQCIKIYLEKQEHDQMMPQKAKNVNKDDDDDGDDDGEVDSADKGADEDEGGNDLDDLPRL